VTDDPAFYSRALRRMTRIGIVLACVLTLAAGILYGPRNAIGFGFGAALSILNFHWWKGVAAGMGGDTDTPRRPASAAFLGMRYVLLGGICFVIIKFFEVSYLALLAGLLISVAAVLVEIVYELIFTR
jgi:hypothetical protein